MATRTKRKRVVDPTKTTTLRKRLVSKIRGRANKLKASIRRYIVQQDALLLTDNRLKIFAEIIQPGDSPTVKVQKFREWMEEQIQTDFIKLDETGSLVEVVNSDINDAFLKGTEMGKASVQGITGDISDTLTRSTRTSGSLSSAFGPAPIAREELELVFNTTRDNLINLADDMASKAAGAVSRGLISGQSPVQIAQAIVKEIDIQTNRAVVTARTEIIRAHHIGNVGEMKAAGLEDVTVLAEWSTAKDGRVCQNCVRLEGRIFTIDEISGLIPLHPQCRCVAIPIIPGVTPVSGRPTQAELLAWTAPSAKTKKGKLKPTTIESPKPGFSEEAAEKRQEQQAQNEEKFNALQQELNTLFAELSNNSQTKQESNQSLIWRKLFAQNTYLHEKSNLLINENIEQAAKQMRQSLYMQLRPHAKQGIPGESIPGKPGAPGKPGKSVKGDKGDLIGH